MKPPTPVQERLFPRIDAEGDCWIWTGARNIGGYGVINVSREVGVRVVHRVVWDLLVGSIPEGVDMDHICRVRACCNPDHLEPVSRGTNVDRGSRGAGKPRRTHCVNDHEFTPENTIYRGKARACRACSNIRNRQYRQRRTT